MKKYFRYILLFLCFAFLFLLCFLIYHKGLSLGEIFSQGWNDFRRMENMQEYSINWHTGVLIGGNSIIKYGYILFVFVVFFVFAFLKFKRRKNFGIIFFVGIGMFLFVGIRNVVGYTYILSQGLSGFKNERMFYDIGDYIGFIEKVRNELNLDSYNALKGNCKIYIGESFHWAIEQHGRLYLVPCEVVSTGELADYKIYYKREVPKGDADKQILLKFSGSYLLDNNESKCLRHRFFCF